MTDFINKLIAILLAVVICIIAPLNLRNMSTRAEQKLMVVNRVQMFIDKVCDKGSVQASDLDELARELAATGMIINFEVEEYRFLAEADSVNLARICEITYDRIESKGGTYKIGQGNVIRVSFKEAVISTEANLWYKIIGSLDTFEDYLSGMRR